MGAEGVNMFAADVRDAVYITALLGVCSWKATCREQDREFVLINQRRSSNLGFGTLCALQNNSIATFISKYCQYDMLATSSYQPICIGMPMCQLSFKCVSLTLSSFVKVTKHRPHTEHMVLICGVHFCKLKYFWKLPCVWHREQYWHVENKMGDGAIKVENRGSKCTFETSTYLGRSKEIWHWNFFGKSFQTYTMKKSFYICVPS